MRVQSPFSGSDPNTAYACIMNADFVHIEFQDSDPKLQIHPNGRKGITLRSRST